MYTEWLVYSEYTNTVALHSLNSASLSGFEDTVNEDTEFTIYQRANYGVNQE